MNTNAIPYRSENTERVEVTPIDIATHAGSATSAKAVPTWSPSYLSVPLARISADLVLLLTGTMIGGMLGHLLQRTQSFELGPQQLIIGSLIYTGLVLCLLQTDNAYPRVCSLLHVKETETVLRVSIKAIMISLLV